jgi:hypothetical protein
MHRKLVAISRVFFGRLDHQNDRSGGRYAAFSSLSVFATHYASAKRVLRHLHNTSKQYEAPPSDVDEQSVEVDESRFQTKPLCVVA